MRKSILLAGILGIGGGVAYWLTRGRKSQDAGASENGHEKTFASTNGENSSPSLSADDSNQSVASSNADFENVIIDDQGTDQIEAANILKQIRDAGFDSSDEKLALALGRPAEEIEAWTTGGGHIDADVILKARGLALERGIETS